LKGGGFSSTLIRSLGYEPQDQPYNTHYHQYSYPYPRLKNAAYYRTAAKGENEQQRQKSRRKIFHVLIFSD
jgi:hypothetical protein